MKNNSAAVWVWDDGGRRGSPREVFLVVEQLCILVVVVVTQTYSFKEMSELDTCLRPLSMSGSGYCALITEDVATGRNRM